MGPGLGLGGARGASSAGRVGGFELVCDAGPPVPRLGAALAGNGEVVLLFGGVNDESQPLDDTWLYDGTSWPQLSAGGDGSSPRFAAQLAWNGESFVLFSGLGVLGEENVVPAGADTWR